MDKKDPLQLPEEILQAENDELKRKLSVEYGMHMHDMADLHPALENEWLKSIYAFEQNFKNAKKIKLYEYIGRPTFRKWDTLTPEEIRSELERLELLMENNGVQLDCICKYNGAVIYRFITEELFLHEMDDMRSSGMMCHFIYEEFHPNHDYELRSHTSRLIDAIFTRPWDEEFDGIHFAGNVSFSGNDYDRRGLSSIIRVFQEAHRVFTIEKIDINHVDIDSAVTKAEVTASVCVSGKMKGGDSVRYEGICAFHFNRSDDYWHVEHFSLPPIVKLE